MAGGRRGARVLRRLGCGDAARACGARGRRVGGGAAGGLDGARDAAVPTVPAGRPADSGAGGVGCGPGDGRCGWVLWRELAGGPEQEGLFQAGEEAGEAGHDEGVQGGRQPAVRLVRLGGLP